MASPCRGSGAGMALAAFERLFNPLYTTEMLPPLRPAGDLPLDHRRARWAVMGQRGGALRRQCAVCEACTLRERGPIGALAACHAHACSRGFDVRAGRGGDLHPIHEPKRRPQSISDERRGLMLSYRMSA